MAGHEVLLQLGCTENHALQDLLICIICFKKKKIEQTKEV